MTRPTIYETPRAAAPVRGDGRHQHLRPQLRRALRGQRPRRGRPHRQDLHRSRGSGRPSCRRSTRASAASAQRRARLPSRPAHAIRCAGRARAAPARFEPHLVGRGARRRWRARCGASATRTATAAILDASRSGNLSMLHNRAAVAAAASTCSAAARSSGRTSRRRRRSSRCSTTYGAKASSTRAPGREPTDYLELAADRDVGLEPGRRARSARTPSQYLKWAKQHGVRIVCVDPRQTRIEPRRWPTSTSSSGRPPTPPR